MQFSRNHRKGQTDIFSAVIVLVFLALTITLVAQVHAQRLPTGNDARPDCHLQRSSAVGQPAGPMVGSRALHKAREDRCQNVSLSALQVLGIWAVSTR